MNKIASALILLFIIQSVSFAQEVTVASSEDLDFKKYKTFMWDSQVNNEMEQGGIYFLDDLVIKSQLRDALQNELSSSGYEFDKTNADLSVHFVLFGEKSNAYNNLPENLVSYKTEPGTLVISLIDSSNSKVIWQASAGGLSKEEILKDESMLKEVVAKIFQESALAKK
jgi:hypothetical protein